MSYLVKLSPHVWHLHKERQVKFYLQEEGENNNLSEHIRHHWQWHQRLNQRYLSHYLQMLSMSFFFIQGSLWLLRLLFSIVRNANRCLKGHKSLECLLNVIVIICCLFWSGLLITLLKWVKGQKFLGFLFEGVLRGTAKTLIFQDFRDVWMDRFLDEIETVKCQ